MWGMTRSAFFLLFCLAFTQVCGQTSSSVLAEGQWFKIAIAKDGVYKIDNEFISRNLSIDPQSFDARTLKVYGNGGRLLPQANSIDRPQDLIQNPTFKEGLEDGIFEPGDFLLFYGLGPHQLEIQNDQIYYENNVYSDSSFYFITIGGDPSESLTTKTVASGDFPVKSVYQELIAHEIDERNILKSNLSRGGSGREWYGEVFQRNVNTERDYDFQAPGFTGKGKLLFASLSQSEAENSFSLAMNGTTLGDQRLTAITPVIEDEYEDRGNNHIDTFAIDVPPSNDLTLNVTFNFVSGQSSIARLNYFVIQAERELAIYDGQTHFSNGETSDGLQFEIENVSNNSQIWDISDPYHPQLVPLDLSGSTASFVDVGPIDQKYVVLQPEEITTPSYIGSVANQNIRGAGPQEALIIAHPRFLAQAQELAAFHQTTQNLQVGVFNIQEVYNEFGSGSNDITAVRDMIRYFYQNSPNLGYALLFGDCSYDYKDQISNNTNLVPTYQSRNSIHPIFSFSSDDYFGFMEEQEGEWIELSSGDHTLDIGVGRIPAKTTAEATDMVNKIIRYSTSERVLGNWKNTVTYVADDGDRNIHLQDGESFAEILDEQAAQILPRKIYLDAFEQELGASQETSPILTDQINQAITEGTFLVNYIGHGNEFQWMDENTLDTAFVSNLTNRFRLPIFVTATCQFGRYDDPDFFSGSERLLLDPNGGAIALLTTTRPVFASSNRLVNEAFHENIFRRENGQHLRLGDIIRITKNQSLRGPRNRNFALLGDPMLTLQYPDFIATIDEINGKNIALESDTLSALEEITLRGTIRNQDSTLNDGFNGIVDILLLDAASQSRTLGQESIPTSYRVQENALFRGKASVTNGQFSTTFILTRNISYRFLEGKISLYAIDEENGVDASGATNQIRLGGTAPALRTDNAPPEIDLYLNDEQFVNGSAVESSSILIARVFDLNGLNISENSINQNITLTLNDEEPIVINDFYTADVDDYQNGFVTYPLNGLDAGKYTATIKLWDTYNNSATQTVEFIVSDTRRISMENVFNYPNPAKGTTTFNFEHNRPGEELEITIDIYGVDGALKATLYHEIDDSPTRIDFLNWDITASTLEQGLYLYKITVKSTLDGAVGQQVKRLIVN